MTIALAAVGFINGDITYNKEQIKRIIKVLYVNSFCLNREGQLI